jgi:hypothetical protein
MDTGLMLKAQRAAEGFQQQPVASLSEFYGRVPPVEEIGAAFIAQLSHILRGDVFSGAVGLEEADLTERLLAEGIGVDAFVADDDRKREPTALRREVSPP